MMMRDILVIDDHWMVRRGLSEVLSTLPDQGEIFESESINEGIAMLNSRVAQIDIVVLDLVFGDESSLSSIRLMKSIKDSLRILVLSYLDEEPHGVYAVEQGADGYLTKGGHPHELLDAVRVLRSGRNYVSTRLNDLLAKREQFGKELSAREWEVIRCYVNGKGCVETGKLLSLSPKTVSSHKMNAMRKLAIQTNADLIRWGLEHGVT